MSVTTSMIATALGKATPTSGSITDRQWAMWIDDAEMLIDVRRQKLGVESLDANQLDYVVREAVVAHIKKPDDATQVTIAVDDASTSKSYKSGKGRVTIVDEWWELLGLTEPEGAFSIDMVPRAGAGHLAWCSLLLGATYCSCGVDIAGTPIYEVDG